MQLNKPARSGSEDDDDEDLIAFDADDAPR